MRSPRRTDWQMRLTRPRMRLAGLAIALLGGVLVFAPLLVQAVAANLLGVALLRTTQPLATSWLRPDPRAPMLWSAQRHLGTLDAGSPMAGQVPSLTVRIGEWAASFLPADRSTATLARL